MMGKINSPRILLALGIGVLLSGPAPAPPSMSDILAASPPSDWRTIDPSETLVMELPAGRVVIELAPAFAPMAIANIKTLARAHYFDGAAVVRAQDNYVVQWARSDHRLFGAAKSTIAPEFDRPMDRDIAFTPLPDPDTYAPQTGFSSDFPAARDPAEGRVWLTHCYGMVGVGRDNAADSGNGSELYAVIGQSPRNLDRNVTLIGRVVEGMELLSTLPRGTGALGFYEKPSQRLPISSIRLASDMPAAERSNLEALRTDSATFRALLKERRTRPDPWYKHSPGHIGVCNVPLPVRAAAPKA
ncbi:MAG TPA: peptidylprolyl isomerase [Rhizomicrobium sp.]|jgi:peptidylprolyl isomerase|nr:peptidylprolyl isomerase [Rhizomicrobium sp.]